MASQTTASVQVMLPGQAGATTVQAGETANLCEVLRQLLTSSGCPNPNDLIPVLPPSRRTSGRVIGPDELFGAVVTDLIADFELNSQDVAGTPAPPQQKPGRQSYLELWLDPRPTRVALFDGSKELKEMRCILVDWGVRLTDCVPVLQKIYHHHPFGLKTREELVIRAFTPADSALRGAAQSARESRETAVTMTVTGAERLAPARYYMRWLTIHRTLGGQGIIPDAFVVIVPFSMWARRSLPESDPPFAGNLLRQQRNITKSKKYSAKEKRYVVASSSFLYIYKSKEKHPSAPEEVIPLDYYSLKRIPLPVAIGLAPPTEGADPGPVHANSPRAIVLQRIVHHFLSKDAPTEIVWTPESPNEHRVLDDVYRCLRRACAQHNAVFGIPLGLLMRRLPLMPNGQRPDIPGPLRLPEIITGLVTRLQDPDAMSIEGLFRVSGDKAVVDRWRDAFDCVDDILDAPELDFTALDPHVATSLLKLFLRELPDPLLTSLLHKDLVSIATNDSEGDKNKQYASIVSLLDARLPPAHRMVLLYLCNFFSKVASRSEQNKMHVSNLATVLGPNVLFAPGRDVSLSDTLASTTIVEALLTNDGFKRIRAKLAPGPGPTVAVPRALDSDFERRQRARNKVMEMRRQARNPLSMETAGEFDPEENNDGGSDSPQSAVTFDSPKLGPPKVVRNDSYNEQRRRFATMSSNVLEHAETRDDSDDSSDDVEEEPRTGRVRPTSSISILLAKQGLLRKRNPATGTWQVRLFRFDGGNIQYFCHSGEPEPVGEIALTDITRIFVDFGSADGVFQFERGGVLFELQAPTEAERDSWVGVLQRFSAELTTTPTSDLDPDVVVTWNEDENEDHPGQWQGFDAPSAKAKTSVSIHTDETASPATIVRLPVVSPVSPIPEPHAKKPAPAPVIVNAPSASVARPKLVVPKREVQASARDPPPNRVPPEPPASPPTSARDTLPPHVLSQIPGLQEIEVDGNGDALIAVDAKEDVVSGRPVDRTAVLEEKVSELEQMVNTLRHALRSALDRIDALESGQR